MQICGAKTRQGGKCKTSAMPNGRCRMHGGLSARGMEAGRFKDGRYSKVLPVRLLAQYEASLKDPELLDLKKEIAVLDTRLAEQIAAVEHGEAGYVWDRLTKENTEFSKAKIKGDTAEMQIHLMEMCRLIERGAQDVAAWREIHAILEQRRRFVESETKRQLQLSAGVTLDQVGVFFHALTQAVKEEVDKDVLARIQSKFDRLTAQDNTLRLVG